MKKRVNVLVLFGILILSAIFLMNSALAINVGLVDGYIKDVDGNPVADALVRVKLNDCLGEGCSGAGVSESTGYYVIGNLGLGKNSGLVVSAEKSGARGSSAGNADQFYIAHIDVVVCYAPSSPTLTAIDDSHSRSFNFKWVSGTDPAGKSVHDLFAIDNNTAGEEKPPIVRNVEFGEHGWKVQTCNEFCCGNFAEDKFLSYNNPPSIPIASQSIEAGIAVLSWQSGVDPDGDPVHDEFQSGEEEIISNAISPVAKDAGNLIKWKVRTCDNLGACSNWSEQDAFSCPLDAGCPSTDEIARAVEALGRQQVAAGAAAPFALSCNGIVIKQDDFKSLDLRIYKGKLSLRGPGLLIDNLEFCPWCYDNKKNYDEAGIDCGGGSCPACKGYSYWDLIVILCLIAAGILAYFYIQHRKKKKWGRFYDNVLLKKLVKRDLKKRKK